MQHIKTHILSKLFTLLLATALLAPSATKFAHTFTHEHHKHDYCKGEKNTHLHELDTDCEFYKFNLNKSVFHQLSYSQLTQKQNRYKIPVLAYTFLNNHKPLSFSLRGPPALV